MKRIIRMQGFIIISAIVTVGLLTSGAWAQSSLQGFDQVEIRGPLPRTAGGAVDAAALRQTVADQFARGIREVQFRDFTLTAEEERQLFLTTNPNENLLRLIAGGVPAAGGAERNVTFRGMIDGREFRARVGREEGQLRARLEGVDLSQLSAEEQERVLQNLRTQSGFDRVRLDGGNDRGGLQADNRGRGSSNRGPGSANSGPGSLNSGPGSFNSGPGRGDNGRRGGRNDVRLGQDDVRQEDRREDRRLGRREDRREDRRMDRREDRREDRQFDRREDRREDRQFDRQLDRREDRQFDRRADSRFDRSDRADRSGRR